MKQSRRHSKALVEACKDHLYEKKRAKEVKVNARTWFTPPLEKLVFNCAFIRKPLIKN